MEGRLHERGSSHSINVANNSGGESGTPSAAGGSLRTTSHQEPPVFSVQHSLHKPSARDSSPVASMHSVHPTKDDLVIGSAAANASHQNNGASLDSANSENQVSSVETGFRLKHRANSLVGTIAYMAPEVLQQFGKGVGVVAGYTDAVDWWSLGVTIYKLLVGVQPFNRVTYDELHYGFPAIVKKHEKYHDAFVEIFGTLSFVDAKEIDGATEDLIRRLLTFDASSRLGE